MFRFSELILVVVGLAAFLLGSTMLLQAQPTIWEDNFGDPVGLEDDDTDVTTFGALRPAGSPGPGFSFPFGGTVFSGDFEADWKNSPLAFCAAVGSRQPDGV